MFVTKCSWWRTFYLQGQLKPKARRNANVAIETLKISWNLNGKKIQRKRIIFRCAMFCFVIFINFYISHTFLFFVLSLTASIEGNCIGFNFLYFYAFCIESIIFYKTNDAKWFYNWLFLTIFKNFWERFTKMCFSGWRSL